MCDLINSNPISCLFTSDSLANSKVICSIFIYFGVACIGLLLGSYIAGMMDDKAYRERKSAMIEACPNCKRIQTLKEAAERRQEVARSASLRQVKMQRFMSERVFEKPESRAAVYENNHHHKSKHGHSHHDSNHNADSVHSNNSRKNSRNLEVSTPPRPERKTVQVGVGVPVPNQTSPAYSSNPMNSPELLATSPTANFILGSPATRDFLHRQGHTRHSSIGGAGTSEFSAALAQEGRKQARKYSADLLTTTPTIAEGRPLLGDPPTSAPNNSSWMKETSFQSTSSSDSDEDDFSVSSSSSSSVSTVDEIMDDRTFKMKAAKYVFLTLRQALVNSMVIIAIGCLGFWLIEGFSLIDSWYFTTVFLTTVGYGDIVPITSGGKLFATVYILVAGTILLNNMSMISLIPLELRKRRIERAVLTQFGDQLDDDALRELATGPVIQRLHLSANRPDGLQECTREMFSLAMLVRLGKVTEQDIRESFAAFRKLDVNDEGVLNSKSIIAGMIQKRRSLHPSERSGRRQRQQRGVHAVLSPIDPNEMPPMPELSHRTELLQGFSLPRQPPLAGTGDAVPPPPPPPRPPAE